MERPRLGRAWTAELVRPARAEFDLERRVPVRELGFSRRDEEILFWSSIPLAALSFAVVVFAWALRLGSALAQAWTFAAFAALYGLLFAIFLGPIAASGATLGIRLAQLLQAGRRSVYALSAGVGSAVVMTTLYLACIATVASPLLHSGLALLPTVAAAAFLPAVLAVGTATGIRYRRPAKQIAPSSADGPTRRRPLKGR